MRILVDTNFLIDREDNKVLSSDIKELSRIFQKEEITVLVHPLSKEEIGKYEDKDKRDVSLSKIGAYQTLESPPEPNGEFLNKIGGKSDSFNEYVDNNLLFCLYKNAIEFLITNDNGIHDKAEQIGLEGRVFTVSQAEKYLKKYFSQEEISADPPILEKVPFHNVDPQDPIFDTLRENYDFIDWWERKSKEGRKAWIYRKEDESLGACLVLKKENEALSDANPSLPKKTRVKICTLVVSETGYKLGELFIKMAIKKAVNNQINEIYLTHYTKEDDFLIPLIKNFGFYKKSEFSDGEDIFIKKLTVEDEDISSIPSEKLSKKYYPTFYDGEGVKKFLVPIQPEYHRKLFPCYEGRDQFTLNDFSGPITEGNTIKKAYISHANTKKISSGDVLLFYRSEDQNEITSLGVVEETFYDLTEEEEILKKVGRRTVFSKQEIENMSNGETLVILFRWHFHFENPVSLEELRNLGLNAPMTIIEILDRKYSEIKRKGGLDERFIVN